MNLYSINFSHFGPKDSRNGIQGYLIAANDEAVLDWLLKAETMNGEPINTKYWADSIEEGDTTRERLLQHHGRLEDDEFMDELSDLYYGHTVYGWKFERDVAAFEVDVLVRVGVAMMA